MSQTRNKSTKPYIVSVVQDLSECAEVQVNATSSAEAEEIVSALLRQGKLNSLDYTPGDNQRDPYTCGSWEKDDDTAVDCIVTDSGVTFPPKTNINTLRNSHGLLTVCPQCGAELNAFLRLTLYTITLDSTGHVSAYEGGPQPESTSDTIELSQAENTTIICTNNHHISGPSLERSSA
jgi:hypothetical protein